MIDLFKSYFFGRKTRKARGDGIVRLWDEKWVAAEMISHLKRLTDIALDLGDNFIIRCGCS